MILMVDICLEVSVIGGISPVKYVLLLVFFSHILGLLNLMGCIRTKM